MRCPPRRAFAGTMAMITHMATKTARMSSVFHSLRDESRSAMASTGHSSPQVPNDRMPSPTGVPSRSRSLMIGMSVPSAVVVSAMATASPSMWLTERLGDKSTRTSAIAMLINQVASPFFPCVPERLFGLIS